MTHLIPGSHPCWSPVKIPTKNQNMATQLNQQHLLHISSLTQRWWSIVIRLNENKCYVRQDKSYELKNYRLYLTISFYCLHKYKLITIYIPLKHTKKVRRLNHSDSFRDSVLNVTKAHGALRKRCPYAWDYCKALKLCKIKKW